MCEVGFFIVNSKVMAHKTKKKKLESKEKCETKKLKIEDTTLEETNEKSNQKPKGRLYTVSIAVPASILDILQTLELKTCLVGQIARAAAVNNVDEIIVFDDTNSMIKGKESQETNKASRNCNLMMKIFDYLECPQYLRKYFFPLQPDLRCAGLLNPLDAPHQMRADDTRSAYREGVIVNKEVRDGHKGSFANVGLSKDCLVNKSLVEGVRCTVKIDNYQVKKLKGTLVSYEEPREKSGMYWGYKTRLAVGLTDVLQGSYDCIIGTSDKGTSIDNFTLPSFKSLLIVFGGVQGLETCIESDESLAASKPTELFEHYINTRPNQGSATIRTEEAILITLAALRPQIEASST